MTRRAAMLIVVLLGVWVCSPAAWAAYLTDVGFDVLQAALGTGVPTGAGVRVGQVEAPSNDVSGGAAPIFMPDPTSPEFVGKTITPVGGNLSGAYSSHATEVGRLLYGTASSIAPGLTQIDSYEANGWINSLYNPVTGRATSSPDRVINHSWVGGGADAVTDGTVLRLVDRQVALNDSIQVVGVSNGNGSSPLLGSAYNVIAVGRTDGINQQGSVPVSGDALYGAGRTRPDIVAPEPLSSMATPVVSAAAALLVQAGHNGGLTWSQGSTTKPGVGTIYDAERSATVKAALMAGADRQTANTSTPANITDYRGAGHQTVNGLDDRYGAGQVNINNSYRIVAGGEQRSAQNGGHDISLFGFDYGMLGGLNGSPRTASYFFTAHSDLTLFASLVWNISIANDSTLAATLHHLGLSLFDVTRNTLVASSASGLDNTQHLFLQLFLGDRYELRVTTDEAGNFLQDYALAWRMEAAPSPVPVPASGLFFASGLLGLSATRCFRRIGGVSGWQNSGRAAWCRIQRAWLAP